MNFLIADQISITSVQSLITVITGANHSNESLHCCLDVCGLALAALTLSDHQMAIKPIIRSRPTTYGMALIRSVDKHVQIDFQSIILNRSLT